MCLPGNRKYAGALEPVLDFSSVGRLVIGKAAIESVPVCSPVSAAVRGAGSCFCRCSGVDIRICEALDLPLQR